jgi:hypothetical protein
MYLILNEFKTNIVLQFEVFAEQYDPEEDEDDDNEKVLLLCF